MTKPAVLGCLKNETEIGSFKKTEKWRSIKPKDATHSDNKQNNNEEIKDYDEENYGDKKMGLLYAIHYMNSGWFVTSSETIMYIYPVLLLCDS